MSMLAYIPFLNPIWGVQHWWYLLLIPLSFGIAVIYKAVRLNSLEDYWKHVLTMTAQIVLAMVGLAVCLILIVQFIIPHLPAE